MFRLGGFPSYILLICSHVMTAKDLPELIADRIIVINTAQAPTLEYIALSQNPYSHDPNISEDKSMEDVFRISLDQNESSTHPKMYLSTRSNIQLFTWILENQAPQVDFHPLRNDFFSNISSDVSQFASFKQAQFSRQLAKMSRLWEENNYSMVGNVQKAFNTAKVPLPTVDTPKNFGDYALYLIVGGSICAIYSVMAPSGSAKQGKGVGKIVKARRKRWLKKIYDLGWIDQTRYLFLLKKLETLPNWLGGIQLPDQSLSGDLAEETSVDLSKRKRGESVVSTKDTSSDNTSL